MRQIFNGLAMAIVVSAGLVATDAAAQNGRPRATQSQTPSVPRCAQSLGTISIQNGDTYQGWRQYNLQPPAGLLRVVVLQSGCFTIVERGTGLEAVQREQALAGVARETLDLREIDAHLDLRRDLVDVLTAGSRRAHGADLHRALGHDDIPTDVEGPAHAARA